MIKLIIYRFDVKKLILSFHLKFISKFDMGIDVITKERFDFFINYDKFLLIHINYLFGLDENFLIYTV